MALCARRSAASSAYPPTAIRGWQWFSVQRKRIVFSGDVFIWFFDPDRFPVKCEKKGGCVCAESSYVLLLSCARSSLSMRSIAARFKPAAAITPDMDTDVSATREEREARSSNRWTRMRKNAGIGTPAVPRHRQQRRKRLPLTAIKNTRLQKLMAAINHRPSGLDINRPDLAESDRRRWERMTRRPPAVRVRGCSTPRAFLVPSCWR